ncbi:hypothetical protein [Halomonas sp. HL-93]|uniref:hypothetical protein n=1 Tax=Halomonas sp. HL-93 TaxID=1666906 RepID=UPI0006DB485D|nr:hypothetical protein [Halomonas sp. HL-93]KPQ26567.1 MAG: hypothetical protein HLUCCO06_10960 [Halomonas sp. HL-93]SBR47171.1 hypothetical protein GA0071314_1070 [Halomonas sp. HL-93]
MKTQLSLAVTLALVSAGLLSGCSDDKESAKEASTLSYIPADSPYFMASSDTMPEQEAFDLFQRMQPMSSLESDLDELRDTLPELEDDKVQHALGALLIAMGEELVGVESLEDVHALGLKMSPQVAFYGLGILPVLRMQLQDEEAFRETLQRILTKAEITPSTATTNGTDYWVLTPEAPVKAILAIIDQQLLISIVPQDASDELMAQVLGSDLPDSNLEDSGALAELEQRHDFTPYGAGEVDFSRLLNELSSPSHAGTQALMDAVEAEQLDLSACQADIDRITSRFPGLVMGMREYNQDRMEMNVILETDEEIVSDLRALTTQVPGLGSTDGMASIGMGLNLPLLLQTVQQYAQQVRQNPFSCDELQDLNSAWSEINTAMNNPATMMIGSALSGLRARIDSLTMTNGEPSGSGILTLASPNPMGLVTTASAFVPELGALELEPGGDAKQIESMMLPPETPALHAAMSNNAIALGADISDPASLQKALEAPASEQDLLLHGHLTSEFYHSLADVMEQVSSDEVSASDIDAVRQYADIYKNMEYWLRVDDAGVEMSFSAELE